MKIQSVRILSRTLCCSLLFIIGQLPHLAFGISVGKFVALDISVAHSSSGSGNVWEDVSVICTLTPPSGNTSTVKGFYHSKNLWMIRYAPDEIGKWHYAIDIKDKSYNTHVIDSFDCVSSSEQGFIRLHPANPKRWIYSGTGNLYTAVGFGDCMGDKRDSILQFAGLDGGFRPKGYHEGIDWNMPYSQYLAAYGDAAGFNLYRYSDGNCAYSIIKSIASSGNDYDTLHSLWTDTLFRSLRAHGFRIFMTIIGKPTDSLATRDLLRYVQYCINRYGALVDFWELANESDPDSVWVSTLAQYIHAHDPYHHAVSMSNPKPFNPDIDIISPHWYGKEQVTASDKATGDRLESYRATSKPVIFGEQGEGGWDSLSATRLRGRIWSALFNEGTILFWNSTFAKDCPCNQYLGWEERRYVRVLQNFSVLLDSGVRRGLPRQIGNNNLWELHSDKVYALYIRDHVDITERNTSLQVSANIPSNGIGIWYDVHAGDTIGSFPIKAGVQLLTVPAFQTDIAFIGGDLNSSPLVDSLFRIDVKPRTVELTNVPVGAVGKFYVTVTNTGTNPVIFINSFVSTPPSKLYLYIDVYDPLFVASPFSLAPSKTITLPIAYEMQDTGAATAMFSLWREDSPAWENIAVSASSYPTSSVNENEKGAQLSVFPDPAMNIVTVRLIQTEENPVTVSLTTPDGVIIEEKNAGTGKDIVFDVSKLPSGTYRVVVGRNGSVIISRKFVVLH